LQVILITFLTAACGGRKEAPKSSALAIPEVKIPGGDGPHAELARFWKAVLDGDDDEAREHDLRKTYFNSIAVGIGFAKVEIAGDGNSASVKIERPEYSYLFTMKREKGEWRLETWGPNRLTKLLGEAMARLRPRVAQGFYKTGNDAFAAINADLFKSGLPGNYEMEVSQDGTWYLGENGVQIRTDPGGELKADFFKMKDGYRDGTDRIPADDCRLPVFSEGQEFYFDEGFMGWGRFAFRAGNYETMNGQNYHPFGTSKAIRLKYLGPLQD